MLQAADATPRRGDVLIRLPICIYYFNLYNNFQRQSNCKEKNFNFEVRYDAFANVSAVISFWSNKVLCVYVCVSVYAVETDRFLYFL